MNQTFEAMKRVRRVYRIVYIHLDRSTTEHLVTLWGVGNASGPHMPLFSYNPDRELFVLIDARGKQWPLPDTIAQVNITPINGNSVHYVIYKDAIIGRREEMMMLIASPTTTTSVSKYLMEDALSNWVVALPNQLVIPFDSQRQVVLSHKPDSLGRVQPKMTVYAHGRPMAKILGRIPSLL